MYCKSNSNTSQKVNSEIKSVLRDMFNLKEIDQKIMNYLTIKKPQLGRFYLLPNIHKRTVNYLGKPSHETMGQLQPSHETMGQLQKEYLHF